MAAQGPLIPRHGGYRNLKSFQVAQLVYDLTGLFCNTYVSGRSRTHDQMVQAARSGVQNIAEGSQASATSKATEMKLTNVARASLEELRLDYEDFLRQHSLSQWNRTDPRREKLIALRPRTLEDVKRWAQSTRAGHTASTASTVSTSSTQSTFSSAETLANAALALINVATFLLTRQLGAQAAAFERDGGFTERLHVSRTSRIDHSV